MRPTEQRRRRILASSLFVVTTLLVAAMPAAAAPTPSAMNLFLRGTVGARCVEGTSGAGNGKLTVTQKRGGVVIATASDATGSTWRVCVKPLKVADTLIIKKGTATRTVKVPDIRLSMDRGLSRVTGRVPTTNLAYHLVTTDTISDFVNQEFSADREAGADGTFSVLTANQFATDTASLTWISPAGHEWHREAAIPGFIVEVGSSKAIVIGSIGATLTVTLKGPGGATRATATTTLVAPKATVTLKKNGAAVTVADDDTVAITGFPSELELVPDDLTVGGATTGGEFFAHCQPFTRWLGRTYLNGVLDTPHSTSATETGLSGTSGIWDGPGDVPSGYKVVLDCEDSVGLIQRMVATFP